MQQAAGQGGEGDGVLVGGEHLGGAERAGEVRGTVDRLQQASGAAGADDLHVPRRAVVVAGADHGALAGPVGDDDGAGVLGEHAGEARQARVRAGLVHRDPAGGGVEPGGPQHGAVRPRGVVGELEGQAAPVIRPGAADVQRPALVQDTGRHRRRCLRGGGVLGCPDRGGQRQALGPVQHGLGEHEALLDRGQPVLAVAPHGVQDGGEQAAGGPGGELVGGGQGPAPGVSAQEGRGLLLDTGQQAGGDPGAEVHPGRAQSGTVQVHHAQWQPALAGDGGLVHGDQHLVRGEVPVDQHLGLAVAQHAAQPAGEPFDVRGPVGQQVADGPGGRRDQGADARFGQVPAGDVGRVQAGDGPAEPGGGGHGLRVGGEGGEVAVAPLPADEHGRAAAPATLVEGGQVQLPPLRGDLQQGVQRAGRDPQHLAGAGQEQHRVAAGVVAEHARGVPAPLAAPHPLDLGAESGVAPRTAAEQERSRPVRCGRRQQVLAHLGPDPGGTAQHVVALVAGEDQQRPADVGRGRPRGPGRSRAPARRIGGRNGRARRPVGGGCLGAVGDQHRGAGLDPHPLQLDVPAQQRRESGGVQQVLRALEPGVVAQQLERAAVGGRGHRRTSCGDGSDGAADCADVAAGCSGAVPRCVEGLASALRCSTIQRE